MSTRPAKLPDGGTIGIVGPAGPMKTERLEKGVAYLKRRGYSVVLGQHVRDVWGYLAGHDRDRADDLNQMFMDPHIDAVFCTRGGYGSPRLLDFVNYEAIERRPKPLVGYSDITALQLAIFQRTGLVTFSGPMVAVEMGLGIEPFTESNFWPLLSGSRELRRFRSASGPLRILAGGTAEGPLLGGNLSLLCTLVGTEYMPNFEGAILVVEEVGEYPYRIDRKLVQLRLSGLLGSVSGIVFGQFTDCQPDTDSPDFTVAHVLADFAADLNIPIASGLPYGHEALKYTIPWGVRARLNAADGYLELLEPATM